MVAQALVSVDPRSRHRTTRDAVGDRRIYEPSGGARALFFCTDSECLIEGPAGTGKSLACLKKLDRNAAKYLGSRQLIVRKTRTSLTQTALVTFEQQVIIPGGRVRFHTTRQAYLYPNGSEIVVGGLDKDSKVMSSEYDTIYVQEATELDEADAEALTTRLRHGVIPHQQLLMDCNPGPPTHWLNKRCDAGKTTRILSRHEDNPTIIDPATGLPTVMGAAYLAKLDALTGVRKARLRAGKWVAAEGQVLDAFQRSVHVITRDQLGAHGFAQPIRYVAGVDWGYTKPGSIEVHAVDGDGRLCLVDETYVTRKTQDWWVSQGRRVRDEYGVGVFVCDPSEPAYIQAFIDGGLNAVPAVNAILPGITALQERLAIQEDGRARYYVLADANTRPDPELVDAKKPIGFLDEVDAYVWEPTGKKDKPIDDANHAIDPCRYVVMYLDGPQDDDQSVLVVGAATGWGFGQGRRR